MDWAELVPLLTDFPQCPLQVTPFEYYTSTEGQIQLNEFSEGWLHWEQSGWNKCAHFLKRAEKIGDFPFFYLSA